MSVPQSLAANPRLDRWVGFETAGRARVAIGKVEYGQGALTGLAQIAAEELDVTLNQVDLVNPNDSGLAHAVSILEHVEGVAIQRFTSADVVRHPLVGRIVKAYDADAATRGGAR